MDCSLRWQLSRSGVVATRRLANPVLLVLLATGCAGGPAAQADAEVWSAAIKKQDLTSLEQMLSANPDPDLAGGDGKTALMIAAQAGDLDLTGDLIEAGADVNARNEHRGTPLMFAATGGSVPVIRLLIDSGAQLNAVARLGWTALLLASAKGNSAAALLLIEAGAEPNLADGYGWTPLMRALTGRHADTVRGLLDTGLMDLEESGATVLHIAAGEGQADMVTWLLAAGADPALTDGAGRTPAAVAAMMGHEKIAARLLAAENGPAARRERPS